jgi:serine O-acetyltransferase
MNDINLRTAAITAPPERSLSSIEHELWASLRREIAAAAVREEALRSLLEIAVLRHDTFAAALAAMLGRKLADSVMPADRLESLALSTMEAAPSIVTAALADLVAIRTRDPAAEGYAEPFLYYKGFHALEWHRIGNALYRDGRRDIAAFLQSRVSEVFAIDIHPAVPVGTGVFIDHGTGIVVGETAVIGNDVSILQEVTLGGTGKERGDRHPKVRDGVLLSAGAKVLGNIEIGKNAKVGAGSVVLATVPPCATVAGVPARIVGWCRETTPGLAMDQSLPNFEI